MSNDEFLATLIGRGTVNRPSEPFVFNPYGALAGLLIVALIFCAFVFILGLILNDNLITILGGFIGLMVLGFLIGCYYKDATLQTQYSEELTEYNAQMEIYNQEQEELKAKAKELVSVRKTYTIYLDGKQVDYDSVLFSQYAFSIDDENQTIYLKG